MKRRFRETNFRTDSVKRIEQMNSIIEEYEQAGLRLTARQLYYQFVSRAFIENTPRSYKNLTGLLADARYAGLFDWNSIEESIKGRAEKKRLADLEIQKKKDTEEAEKKKNKVIIGLVKNMI